MKKSPHPLRAACDKSYKVYTDAVMIFIFAQKSKDAAAAAYEKAFTAYNKAMTKEASK
jgi:hypothetical protein